MIEIDKQEVGRLIELVERSIFSHKSGDRIHSAKKVLSGKDGEKFALARLMRAVTELIEDSVIDGNLPPEETIKYLLAILAKSHTTKG